MEKNKNCIENAEDNSNDIRKQKLMDLEYQFIREFIALRKDLHLTQKEMGEPGEVIRETVARIENQVTSPQINTLIKILEPFGYTIKIAEISNVK